MILDPRTVELGRAAMDPTRKMHGLELATSNPKLGDLVGVLISVADASRGLKSVELTDAAGHEATLAAVTLFLHDWFQREKIEV